MGSGSTSWTKDSAGNFEANERVTVLPASFEPAEDDPLVVDGYAPSSEPHDESQPF
jgi:hypothetical protein